MIGTAGHVDHGKSTLVKALTGIDPDRLAEEQARAMTIDLGFAWLTLPSGRQVSLVDVPGHERFIKNMLAGVGGIDIAMLVIAADEGCMPQTDEHLAIIDLLQIPAGLIVLTKADLVDAEWLDLMMLEVRDRVAKSILRDAPIIPVSAITGLGMDTLRSTLDDLAAALPARHVGTRPRLPIDRAFSIAGFGTVVTGTLLGGSIAVGDALRLEPSGLDVRVRGLQSHQRRTENAVPGTRVAVNVVGATVEDVHRGDVLAPKGLLSPSTRIDVLLRMLDDAPVTLKQNDPVDLFVGSAEVSAHATLLDQPELPPGATGWVQLRLDAPVAVLAGDRFIVRRPSPSTTIGGGSVIDPHPTRHRRFRPEVIAALETRAQGTPEDLVRQLLEASPMERRHVAAALPALDAADADAALASLVATGEVLVLNAAAGDQPAAWVIGSGLWQNVAAAIHDELATFHGANPKRKGMPKEVLRGKLVGLPPRAIDEILRHAGDQGLIADDGSTVRLPEFTIVLDADQATKAEAFVAALKASPYAPPAPTDLGITPETMTVLEDAGRIVRVADAIAYDADTYARIIKGVLATIAQDGTLTLAAYRDQFATSRKYAQATLEYLDQQRITRRVGDDRVRGAAAAKWEDA